MDIIYVVYWSQSGNTQAKAEAVGKGITDAGKEAAVVYVGDCQTVHCDRCKPHFVFGEFTSPIVTCRNLPQAPDGMTADCCSLV